MEISGIVLAGGKSVRLGRDKTQIIINQEGLFQRVLRSISFINGELIIVISGEESLPGLTGYPRHRVVTDIYPGRGPLGGIFTGLSASRSLYNLVVACDMPFLNQALLSYLIQLAGDSDIVVPRLGNMVEPLHAVYSKSCLTVMESLLKQGKLSVNRLFSLVKIRYVESDEIERFDPNHWSFFNVNTEADLEKAKELAGGEINDKR